MNDIKIVKVKINEEYRYIIVDEHDETKILDNAQGYGFKSYKKALDNWEYKHRYEGFEIKQKSIKTCKIYNKKSIKTCKEN